MAARPGLQLLARSRADGRAGIPAVRRRGLPRGGAAVRGERAQVATIRDTFDCECRGKLDAEGKEQIDMYFVKAERQAVERVKGIETIHRP